MYASGGEFTENIDKAGGKGTASIYEAYLAEGEEIPDEREYSVLMDARGEAERNHTAWRRIHESYWQSDFRKLNIRETKDCK